jgi:uncharacterized repeat protein (TIGR03803 family)
VQNDGSLPSGSLVEGFDGNFYGSTSQGGSNNDGTIYKITPSGVVSILHNFESTNVNDIIDSSESLTVGSDGNIYGTVYSPENGIFQLTISGTYRLFYGNQGFTSSHYIFIDSPLVSNNNSLYGICNTNNYSSAGAIFELNLAASIGPSVSLNTGLNFFSSPYDYTDVSLDSVLGYASPILAVWDKSYILSPQAPADQIVRGTAYWVRVLGDISLPPSLSEPIGTSPTFDIPLNSGWNAVGDPYYVPVSLTNLTFEDGLDDYSQAVSIGLIGKVAWEYDQSTNSYFPTNKLDPGKGVWIYSIVPSTMTVLKK